MRAVSCLLRVRHRHAAAPYNEQNSAARKSRPRSADTHRGTPSTRRRADDIMADGATSTISLRGSVDLVQEFFEYAINSILYQRGIYPPEEFRRVAKYGLSMMVASDDGLQTYLKKILAQLKTWLEEGDVQRLVVVVTCVEINQCVGCTRQFFTKSSRR